jgi:hypothetical protein
MNESLSTAVSLTGLAARFAAPVEVNTVTDALGSLTAHLVRLAELLSTADALNVFLPELRHVYVVPGRVKSGTVPAH